MSRVTLENLLNPVEEIDARPQLQILRDLLAKAPPGEILVPSELQTSLNNITETLTRLSIGPEALRDAPVPTRTVQETVVEQDISINRRTKLATLYRYPPKTYIEYPETGEEAIGHLFQIDPAKWESPNLDFAYSQGKPAGQSRKIEEVFCPLLVDSNGELVRCIKRYSTCQGMKVCPFSDTDALSEPHTRASRHDVEQRLGEERENRLDYSSPQRDIFKRTAAYITTLQNQGCTRSPSKPTVRDALEQQGFDQHQDRLEHYRRGYPKPETCEGRIVFKSGIKPFLMCEHYTQQSKDHWADFSIADGSYDLEYLKAIFSNDLDAIKQIEETARLLDYGPLALCSFVANFSSQKLHCPTEHRDREDNNKLYQPALVHLECKARFRIFEPVEDARQSCPFVLVICQGEHHHPIPLPEKTPPKVRAEIFELLERVGEDLADMTPRSFLRHPAVLSHLRAKFPDVQNPTLSHLHSSLTNRSHLNAYISQAKTMHFPKGTDWKGIIHRKEFQDANIDPADHYIRKILDIEDDTLPQHEEDEPANASHQNKTRIIICMSRQGSLRLRRAQYIQSDIGFKRIVGFLEFEMACMDRDANTSVIFCRIYLNRQTAAAHQRIFQEIEAIVRMDTGADLQWRHLHGESLDHFSGMVLHWAADQHRGQAKGLGLHLHAVAQTRVGVMDLHEPTRLLSSLTPYEHLLRILRMCVVHVYRRIKSCAVSDEVKELMRSLICITHVDWDGTIAKIQQLGGKAAIDWVNDKLSSKFVFPGICWERSHIPLVVWQAGERHSNLIESVHRDVNREGVHCTLLGGVIKGQRFDALKMKALQDYENLGIRPSYHPVHLVVNATKSYKRKDQKQAKALQAADVKIGEHNTKLATAHAKVNEARTKLQELYTQYDAPGSDRPMLQTRIDTTLRVEGRASATYEAQVAIGRTLVGAGSGQVQILLP
ncbi:hypothetical protein DFH06DRAFT_1472990 [Mycena polygramma]|nr:hypothetical protein DFH06DRAFT_1472990 [Mycena polygramma]